MSKFSWKEKLRYGFDNIMSKGTASLIGWLAMISALLILVISLFAWITRAAPDKSFVELIWMSLMRTLDPGTMGGDEGSAVFLLSMFAITLCGIFIISMLIGLLTTGIEAKIETLRKGRSKVLEENHTVILGWSDRVFTIIPELMAANINQKRPCIVIMGNKDKVEMEDELRDRIGNTGNTRIVCRQGNPVDINDLDIAGLDTCKSILIIEESDPNVIKTILAIINNPKRRKKQYHIVASIKDPQNYEVAKLIGGEEVEIVLVDSLISRITAQTCRQSGLSTVYTELLDFGGDEIYFSKDESIAGKTFKEVLLMYEDSAIIGVHSKGITRLNPPMNTVIGQEDEIIAISEDDDTIRQSGMKEFRVNEVAYTGNIPLNSVPENTLILGWNERGTSIINEMDSYVPQGSSVTVAADFDQGQDQINKYCANFIKNQTVEYLHADTKDRRVLNELTARKKYDHIIILCYTHMDVQEADAITLTTLLHLRDISEKTGLKFSIISEMMDMRNRTLAEIAKVNDFIVSDRIISLLLTQISENKRLNSVFQDLFDSDGSEIYIKSAGYYIKPGDKVNFYEIVETAGQHNEVAIGYKIASEINIPGKSYGIYINPKKSEYITLSEGDGIIVLAEA